MAAVALVAYLGYADAPAAIDWLQALGFEAVTRQDDDGRVAHAELRLGDAVVMVASDDEGAPPPPSLVGRSTGAGLYLRTDDVDDLHARAVRAGGREVFPPEETEWGSRRARVLDPGGREWSFGSYEPGRGWG